MHQDPELLRGPGWPWITHVPSRQGSEGIADTSMVMQGGALCSTMDEKEENMDNGNEMHPSPHAGIRYQKTPRLATL